MECSGKSSGARKKAALKFPVGKTVRFLKKGPYTKQLARDAAVYIDAVMAYLVAEVLELAGNVARNSKMTRIIPRHIQRTLRNDDELAELVAKVSGGKDPRVSDEVENIINQFGSFELNGSDGVS